MMNQPANSHLAQVNVGRIVGAPDSAAMAEFMANLDRVNAIAERSPGFVWRLQADDGNAMSIRVSDDPLFAINLSVWETAQNLEHFVWNTIHKRFYQRKAEWFEAPSKPHFAMWWVPVGHLPTPSEAVERVEHLAAHGPSEYAFGWESLPSAKMMAGRQCA